MSPDLHPEELFDKAALGELTAAETAALDAHLAQCAVCRFEHQVAADFAAMPMPSLNIDQLVSNALLAKSSQSLRRRPARRSGALLAAAVALVAMGSFAAVGQWTGALPRLISAMIAPAAAPSLVPVRHSSSNAARGDEALGSPQVSPPPVFEAPPPAEPMAHPLVRAAPRARTTASSPPNPVSQAPAQAEPTPALPVAAPSAADLFAAANRARLSGDRPFAMAKYQQVLRTYPTSAEATLTQATLGKLLLDQGNPAAAVDHLDEYLRTGDQALREDVLGAQAQAFMRLGRVRDERLAWAELLSRYPASVHAARAKARLAALTDVP
jgi:TolA-binding protein